MIGMALVGLGTTPGIHIEYALLSEQTGERVRPRFMAGLMIFFSLGEVLMAGLFMAIGRWKLIMWAVLLPPFLLINLTHWVLAESP